MTKIIEYASKNVKGYNGKKVLIDIDFLPTIQIIDDACKEYGFIFWVTNSYRKDTDVLSGTVVTPANMSNHKVGHALDGNLQHIKSGEWFNSVKMGDSKGIDEQLIQAIINKGVRYGGNFRKEDNVHFDDALNVNEPEVWREKYRVLQGG
jgi:hypothetical protein